MQRRYNFQYALPLMKWICVFYNIVYGFQQRPCTRVCYVRCDARVNNSHTNLIQQTLQNFTLVENYCTRIEKYNYIFFYSKNRLRFGFVKCRSSHSNTYCTGTNGRAVCYCEEIIKIPNVKKNKI